MKMAGMLLWIGGIVVFAWATWVFDPSIATDSTSSLLPDRVVNLGLQQDRALFAIAGLFAFLAGVILQAVGIALDAILIKPAYAPAFIEAEQRQSETSKAIPTEAELVRKSHGIRCIGALNRVNFFCNKVLPDSRGVPRCRQSVAQSHLSLHA